MFICLPQGIQDVGDFVSSVEHKQRFWRVTRRLLWTRSEELDIAVDQS